MEAGAASTFYPAAAGGRGEISDAFYAISGAVLLTWRAGDPLFPTVLSWGWGEVCSFPVGAVTGGVYKPGWGRVLPFLLLKPGQTAGSKLHGATGKRSVCACELAKSCS